MSENNNTQSNQTAGNTPNKMLSANGFFQNEPNTDKSVSNEATLDELIHVFESELPNSGTKVLNIKDMRGEKSVFYSIFENQPGGALSHEEARQLLIENGVKRSGTKNDKSPFTLTLAQTGIKEIPRMQNGEPNGVNRWIETKAVFHNMKQGKTFGYTLKNKEGTFVQFPTSASIENGKVPLNAVDVAQLADGQSLLKDNINIRMEGFTNKEKEGKTYHTANLLTRRVKIGASAHKEQAQSGKKLLKTREIVAVLQANGAQAQAEGQNQAQITQ